MSLGLPAQIRAGLFDLDGVITQTAKVHAQAWKQVFDAFLKTKGQRPFDATVDGIVAEREHLAGKPAPDTYLMAARLLQVEAGQAAVYEAALAGVQAGRAGGFGLVVGIDRAGQADALYAHGADVVVKDLAEVLTE